jgi:hypothetical protein
MGQERESVVYELASISPRASPCSEKNMNRVIERKVVEPQATGERACVRARTCVSVCVGARACVGARVRACV